MRFSIVSLLYQLALGGYHLAIHAAALANNPKAKAWVRGRSDQQRPFWWEDESRHEAKLPTRTRNQPLVWMHVASLGEFEQGKPILERIRSDYPHYFLLLTFYSPSGYERRKDFPTVDAVRYLPPDSPRNARYWVEMIKPDLVIFVTYDFWRFHLAAIKQRQIPLLLIAGVFRADQRFFQRYDFGSRRVLTFFDRIIVQTDLSRRLLASIGHSPEQVTVAGDPRADRVLGLAETPFEDAILNDFCQSAPVLLAGSVWAKDVKLLLSLSKRIPANWKIILAPHQLKAKSLHQWIALGNMARYTRYASEKDRHKQILLLDTIGILSRAYRYARLAYVGGGFGSGIHNTLEPMAYGLPVIIGPKHHKFPEAVTTVEAGGTFVVHNANELSLTFNKLLDETIYEAARVNIEAYTQRAAGATERTFRELVPYLERLSAPAT
ncbi:MAG: glycosyltransferase N-terminal domain-containing protein [Bacteroidota bacterium]